MKLKKVRALKPLRKRLAGMSEDRAAIISKSMDIKIEDIIDKWIDWMYYKGLATNTITQYSEMWVTWLHTNNLLKYPVSVLDMKTLDSFINVKDGSTLLTRKLRLSVARSYMIYCEAEGFILKNPAKIIKIRQRDLTHKQKEPREVLPFTRDEFDCAIKGFNDFIGKKGQIHYHKRARECRFFIAACTIAWWTGLRFGDICKLEIATYTKDTLIVHTDKTNKRVALPLENELIGAGAVKECLDAIDIVNEHHFFPEQLERYNHEYHRCYLHKNFKNWMKRFGIPNRTFHSLRHSFVSRLHEAGSTLEEIGELVGHSRVETTKGYCHGA